MYSTNYKRLKAGSCTRISCVPVFGTTKVGDLKRSIQPRAADACKAVAKLAVRVSSSKLPGAHNSVKELTINHLLRTLPLLLLCLLLRAAARSEFLLTLQRTTCRDHIGPRGTGSKGYEEASQWALARLGMGGRFGHRAKFLRHFGGGYTGKVSVGRLLHRAVGE